MSFLAITKGITDVTKGITNTVQGISKSKTDRIKNVRGIFGPIIYMLASIPFVVILWMMIYAILKGDVLMLAKLKEVVNTLGGGRYFLIIISTLITGSGIAAVHANKKSMDLKADEVKALTEEKKIIASSINEAIKKGVVGDDYVTLTASEHATSKVKEFIKIYAPHAIEIEKKYGLPASAVLAHGALETGWGRHILIGYSSNKEKIQTNNIFNIKKSSDWTGPVAYRKVWEVVDGEDTTEHATFKVYATTKEAFHDYGKLITTKERYKKADEADDQYEYAEALYACGYMTDNKAPSKIKKIIDKYFIYET